MCNSNSNRFWYPKLLISSALVNYRKFEWIGKNFDKWSTKIKVMFDFQEVLDVVMNGIAKVGEGLSKDLKKEYLESKKKDDKALYFIHQNFHSLIFEKISSIEIS